MTTWATGQDPENAALEYKVFGRVPNSTVQWYEKDNGLNEGTSIATSPNDVMFRHELLRGRVDLRDGLGRDHLEHRRAGVRRRECARWP